MASRILPIGMVQTAAFASLAPARKVIAIGGRASELAASVMARTVSEHRTVRLICGDNRFDPYAVARRAKRLGVRAEDVLRAIRIARAFTAFQLTELIDRLALDASSDLMVYPGCVRASLTKTSHWWMRRGCSIARSGASSNWRAARQASCSCKGRRR